MLGRRKWRVDLVHTWPSGAASVYRLLGLISRFFFLQEFLHGPPSAVKKQAATETHR